MNDIIPFAVLLILFGFGMMVVRDYRNVKKSIESRPDLDRFLNEVDNHDPTPYDGIVGVSHRRSRDEKII